MVRVPPGVTHGGGVPSVFRGSVVRVHGGGFVDVKVPVLFGTETVGPCSVAKHVEARAGDRCVITVVNSDPTDLVVIGVL